MGILQHTQHSSWPGNQKPWQGQRVISAARQGGRQRDSWGAIALHPLGKLGHRRVRLLQSLRRQLLSPGCRQAGTAGETVSMRQPKLSAKGCLEEPDPDSALGEP